VPRERGIYAGLGTKHEYLCRSQAVDRCEDALAKIWPKFSEQDVAFSVVDTHAADGLGSPPPEPHDVRAHLHGGVPKREIEIIRLQARAQGFDVDKPFAGSDADYDEFAEVIAKRADKVSVSVASR
jgi:hypothetical protein